MARVLVQAKPHDDDDHHSNEHNASWCTTNVRREDYNSLFNVKFSHVGQCDPDDYEAQWSFFDVAKMQG